MMQNNNPRLFFCKIYLAYNKNVIISQIRKGEKMSKPTENGKEYAESRKEFTCPNGGKWERVINAEASKFSCIVTTTRFIVKFTGGSVIICDRATGNEINRYSGYHYLYTGDVKPDETELFALENGKHFYIISLTDNQPIKRITLPTGYEAIDVCGEYTDDGTLLRVPVEKYTDGKYIYMLCEYETNSYSLVNTLPLWQSERLMWHWDHFSV